MRAKVFELAKPVLGYIETLKSTDDQLLREIPSLVSAINKAAFTDPVFSHPELPALILLAYENDNITIEQMSSMMLIWQAKADFADIMQNFKVHSIADIESRRLFSRYLTIYKKPIRKDVLDASFLNEDMPFSEQHFISFDIPLERLPLIYNTLLNLIGFRFFLPKISDGKARFIVSSYTLLQGALDKIDGEGIVLVPRFGDDTYDTLDALHRERMHPLALSFPLEGFDKLEADLNESLRLGFTLHDLYHVLLLKGNVNLPHIHSLIGATKALQTAKGDDYGKTFSRIVDGELNVLQVLYGADPIVRTFEFYLFAIIQNNVNVTFSMDMMREFLTDESLKIKIAEVSLSKSVKIKEIWVNILLKALDNADFCSRVSFHNMLKALYGSEGIATSLNKIAGFTTVAQLQIIQITLDIIETALFDAHTNNPMLLHFRQWLQDIYDAVASNNQEKLVALIKPDAAVDFQTFSKYGRSLLLLAVENRHADMVSFICETYGLDVSAQSDLLFVACENKDSRTIEALLNNHANPFVRNTNQDYPYEISVTLGDEDALLVFLRYQTIPDYKIMCANVTHRFIAFRKKLENFDGEDASLEQLIAENTDGFNWGTLVDRKDKFSRTVETAPFILGKTLSPTQKIRLLSKSVFLYHYDENSQFWTQLLSIHGSNPLLFAAFRSHPDIQYVLKHFLADKIFLNTNLIDLFSSYLTDYFQSSSGQTSIELKIIDAIAINRHPPIQKLIACGLDINQKHLLVISQLFSQKLYYLSLWQLLRGLELRVMEQKPGQLFSSISSKTIDISSSQRVMMIQHCQADPNQPTVNGDLELILALKADNEAYVRLLFERGASLDYRNTKGETPRMIVKDHQLEWLNLEGERRFVSPG